MEAEDENSVKDKNSAEKNDGNKEGRLEGEKIRSDERTCDEQKQVPSSQATESTGVPENKTKEDQTKNLPVKSEKPGARVSTHSLKCKEQVKDFDQIENGISQENKQIMENGKSRKLLQRTSKSENDCVTDKSSTTAKKSDKNTQPKICQPCIDSEKKAIQDLKSKINSAKANGKSINALLYDMNQDDGTREEKTEESEDVTDGYSLSGVSFDLQGDELSSKLRELKVSDESLNKKLVSASTDESGSEKVTSTSTPEIQTKTDVDEDCDYLSKGPIGFSKHAHQYQPYHRLNQLYQPMPQQVPNGSDICEIEPEFYDEEGLLKALNEIVPETNLAPSPEQYFEPADLHPSEKPYPEILPNACLNGVNNHLYLNPVQGTSPPQQALPLVQPSALPGDISYLPCPIPHQRSTSADTVMQTQAVPTHNEPRPNSYPSTHENLDALFKDASDIIFKDLHHSNQHRSTQKTKSGATFPGVNPMQKAHPSQQVPANPTSAVPVARSQPLASHGVKSQTASGNLNQIFTQVATAKASQIHPKPVMASPLKRQTPPSRPSNGNLPHILQDITDHRNKNETSVQNIPPSLQKSSMGNNPQVQQMAHFQTPTQIIRASTGAPQAQQKTFVNQNPTSVHRQISPQAPGGLHMNNVQVTSANSNNRGPNQPQMIELPCSTSHPLSQRPAPHHLSTVVHASQSITNTFNVPHPSSFPFMENPQMTTCVPKSQPSCSSQGLVQPVMLASNPQPSSMYPNQNGQCVPGNPFPVQNGGCVPMSGGAVPPIMNSVQYVQTVQNGGAQQPVQVIVYPTPVNDKPKPRFRKILPKPSPPVEGGK